MKKYIFILSLASLLYSNLVAQKQIARRVTGALNQVVEQGHSIDSLTFVTFRGEPHVEWPKGLPLGLQAQKLNRNGKRSLTISGRISTMAAQKQYPYYVYVIECNAPTDTLFGDISVIEKMRYDTLWIIQPTEPTAIIGDPKPAPSIKRPSNTSQIVYIGEAINPMDFVCTDAALINVANLPTGITGTIVGNTLHISGAPMPEAGLTYPYVYEYTVIAYATGNYSSQTSRISGKITVLKP